MAEKTTERPPFDPEKVIRGLKKLGNYSVRLHPRRVAHPLPANVSKLGGMILWPEDEPWPVCDGNDFEDEPPHGVAYQPLLQLRKADAVPWLFPDGADLMQLLWCPHQHMTPDKEPGQINSGYRLVWRREQDVKRVRTQAPPFDAPGWARPLTECEFHPEPYTDYPHYLDLEDQMQRRVSEWRSPVSKVANEGAALEHFDLGAIDEITSEAMDFMRRSLTEGAETYRHWVAAAPGTKLLGHPNWVQGPDWYDAKCPRGHAMHFVLQIETDELGRDAGLRWCPVEDRETYQSQSGLFWDGPIRCPHGVMLGDVGSLFLMVCLQCEARPARVIFQCS